MAPILPLLLLMIIVPVWIGLCIGGIVLIALGKRRKKRHLTVLGAIPWLLSAMFVVWQAWYIYRPLEAKAKSFMTLPPSAHVVAVQLGDWGGGTVTFRLPTTTPPSVWLSMVSKMNGWTASSRRVSTGPLDWKWTSSDDDSCELTYDSATSLYYYVDTSDV